MQLNDESYNASPVLRMTDTNASINAHCLHVHNTQTTQIINVPTITTPADLMQDISTTSPTTTNLKLSSSMHMHANM